MGHQDNEDLQVALVSKDQWDVPVLMDPQDLRETVDFQDPMDIQDLKDLVESPASVEHSLDGELQ